MEDVIQEEEREVLTEEEQEWATELADLIHEANMAHYMAHMAGHQPQAFLSTLPDDIKGTIYERAMEILAYRAEQEEEMISEAIH